MVHFCDSPLTTVSPPSPPLSTSNSFHYAWLKLLYLLLLGCLYSSEELWIGFQVPVERGALQLQALQLRQDLLERRVRVQRLVPAGHVVPQRPQREAVAVQALLRADGLHTQRPEVVLAEVHDLLALVDLLGFGLVEDLPVARDVGGPELHLHTVVVLADAY